MIEDITPKNRKEAFLDDISGGENNLSPKTREEYFLSKIKTSGSGSCDQMIVNITGSEPSGDGAVMDKTFGEIFDVISGDGPMPVFRYYAEDDITYYFYTLHSTGWHPDYGYYIILIYFRETGEIESYLSEARRLTFGATTFDENPVYVNRVLQ